jgi:hypothetical protein
VPRALGYLPHTNMDMDMDMDMDMARSLVERRAVVSRARPELPPTHQHACVRDEQREESVGEDEEPIWSNVEESRSLATCQGARQSGSQAARLARSGTAT